LLAAATAADLEHHFDGENAGEDEVEGVEDAVAGRVLVDRVLGGQRDAARADDDHYEQVEVAQVHDEVTETTQPVRHNYADWRSAVSV